MTEQSESAAAPAADAPAPEDGAAREFPLVDILTVTTGIFLCHDVGDLYEILEYLTGSPIFTHQLPAAADAVRANILEQLPQLVDVAPPPGTTGAELKAWETDQLERLGPSLTLRPTPYVQMRNALEPLLRGLAARLGHAAPLVDELPDHSEQREE